MDELAPELGTRARPSQFSMWSLLQSIGFQSRPDFQVLQLRYGYMNLDAAENWSLRGHRIHLFGSYYTGREAGEVDTYVPVQVASQELGLAYLSYVLSGFEAGWGSSKPDWFVMGLRYKHLLPWEQKHAAQAAEYEARPKCHVPRRWARLALSQLDDWLQSLEPEVPVHFSYDGQIFVVAVAGRTFPMPAEGAAWDHRYQSAVKCLFDLPKRLYDDPVEFSMGNECVYIARRRYLGVNAIATAALIDPGRPGPDGPPTETHSAPAST